MKTRINVLDAIAEICEMIPLVGYSLAGTMWLIGMGTTPSASLPWAGYFAWLLGSVAAGGATARFLFLRVNSDPRWKRACPSLTAIFAVMTHALLLRAPNLELGHFVTWGILSFDGIVSLIAALLILKSPAPAAPKAASA